MMKPTQRSAGSVPSPNRGLPSDYQNNVKPFQPGPQNMGPDSSGGSGLGAVDAATGGTAHDASKG